MTCALNNHQRNGRDLRPHVESDGPDHTAGVEPWVEVLQSVAQADDLPATMTLKLCQCTRLASSDSLFAATTAKQVLDD